MTKEQTINKLKDELETMLSNNITVLFKEVNKNNNTKQLAVTLHDNNNPVSCLIYIDDLLNDIIDEKITIHDAALHIINVTNEKKHDNNTNKLMDLVNYLNKDFILENVNYQIINKEMNLTTLQTIPHKSFLDLAVVYRIILSTISNDNSCSILVTNELLDKYQINIDELDAATNENTKKTNFVTTPMSKILSQLINQFNEPFDDLNSLDNNMFVLTNEHNINGATILLYPEYMHVLANTCNSDLYILPSSIHEVIALPITSNNPCTDETITTLTNMVKEVNNEAVQLNEILSYSIYKYSKDTNELTIAQ